jgi:predicted nucleic acid-binding protein
LILADTSIWVDHLHRGDARMAGLLDDEQILMHPLVIGEIALGNLRNRAEIIGRLGQMPSAARADDEEVLRLIERHKLFGTGIGLVDAHLLASTLLTPETRLWTRDRRLGEVAEGLSIAGQPERGAQ